MRGGPHASLRTQRQWKLTVIYLWINDKKILKGPYGERLGAHHRAQIRLANFSAPGPSFLTTVFKQNSLNVLRSPCYSCRDDSYRVTDILHESLGIIVRTK